MLRLGIYVSFHCLKQGVPSPLGSMTVQLMVLGADSAGVVAQILRGAQSRFCGGANFAGAQILRGYEESACTLMSAPSFPEFRATAIPVSV